MRDKEEKKKMTRLGGCSGHLDALVFVKVAFLLLIVSTSHAQTIATTTSSNADASCNPTDFELGDEIRIGPPFNMPPFERTTGLFPTVLAGINPTIARYETPLAIRVFALLDAGAWNCIAAYDEEKSDALTLQRPLVTVPAQIQCGDDDATINTHTTEARAVCMVHSIAAIAPQLFGDGVELLQNHLSLLGFTNVPSGIMPQVQACLKNAVTTKPTTTTTTTKPMTTAKGGKRRNSKGKKSKRAKGSKIAKGGKKSRGNDNVKKEDEKDEFDVAAYTSCLETVAATYSYSPRVMGSIVAQNVIRFALQDGWNMDGTNGGTCTYNCRPYSDTIGYKPKNAVTSAFSERMARRVQNHWQPLLEDDGRGFFFRQQHVTPHIGFRGLPRIIPSRAELRRRRLSNPRYDYIAEAALVTQRLAALNDTTKMEIEFFDDKANVARLIAGGMIGRYLGGFTHEHLILFVSTLLAAEYDATLLAWKEKIRHDLVRTTTVIQQAERYGTPLKVTSWAGPGKGTRVMKAEEFQPYIRVMPHSEFPSGSACICQAGQQVTEEFTKLLFNDTASNLVLVQAIPAGSSKVEPGITPANDLRLVYNIDEMRRACGQSRLNGGMHFTAAVPDSYTLCSGMGPDIQKYLLKLLGGSTDLFVDAAGRR